MFSIHYLSSCKSCSRSGQQAIRAESNTLVEPSGQKDVIERKIEVEAIDVEHPPTVIPMKKINGVFQVSVEVNGQPMNFIFDTGAGYISISSLEAMFLIKQELLSQKDILGTQDLRTATGEISQGTIINIKN